MQAPIIVVAIWMALLGAAETGGLWELLQVVSGFNQFFLALGVLLMFLFVAAIFLPPVRGWIHKILGGASR